MTLKHGRGKHRKYLPLAFSEQGVAMLSSVLRSDRAALVNVAIMREFVRLRRGVLKGGALYRMIRELEHRVGAHDKEIAALFEVIKALTDDPAESKGAIGFRP
ncbi:MAG: hypothetical protein HY553_21460 [Elusimicrobia bacterium]|nr:hypothetical protein [Elusimicrobiota bacterium]